MLGTCVCNTWNASVLRTESGIGRVIIVYTHYWYDRLENVRLTNSIGASNKWTSKTEGLRRDRNRSIILKSLADQQFTWFNSMAHWIWQTGNWFIRWKGKTHYITSNIEVYEESVSLFYCLIGNHKYVSYKQLVIIKHVFQLPSESICFIVVMECQWL